MTELANKILELLKQLAPIIIGWFSAKQDSKIEKLESENETLKEYNEIDATIVNDVYDGGMFSK